MKKKFLSLMMAAAVVATTSVSAFAEDKVISTTPTDATGEKRLTISDGEGQTTNIGITGNIADEHNDVVPTTISVTVPTAAKFTVTKAGELVGSNITIKNEGNETVSVIAEKFIDKTEGNRINVVAESAIVDTAETDRKKVSLTLTGDLASVSLKSATSGTGLVKANGDDVVEGNGVVLDDVEGRNSKTLKLAGKAVKKGNPLTEAIDDEFTLILRIKKKA